MREKVNYFVHQDGLQELLKSLKENTDDFRTLLQQCGPRQERSNVSMASQKSKFKVSRYQKVQEAAESLYHAFGLACTKHTKHQACLRLRADCGDISQIQFTLLLEETGNISRAPSTDNGHAPSLQLTIESQVCGTVATSSGSDDDGDLVLTIKSCGKRVFQPAECDFSTRPLRPAKQKKVVAFAPRSPLFTLPTLGKGTRQPDFPNFCTNSNFCTHVKHVLDQGLTNDRPLGYLHQQGCSKHLIYLKSRTQTISLRPKSDPSQDTGTRFSTLRALCRAEEKGPRISKLELCSLAKQLSIAVLQYRATPWLGRSWDSDHVLLSSRSGLLPALSPTSNPNADSDLQCSESYLDVSINNPQEGIRTPVSDRSRTLIRNWVLFSLGVMLLELAYSRSLRSMQKPQDIDPHNEHNTDYYTADRLQPSVASVMGAEYAELVRKCIQCDFGCGSDLATTKLQEGFYEDVVYKLEDIETRFKSLGI